MKKILILAALALTAAACGGSSKKTTATGATIACNYPADGECDTVEGDAAAVTAAGYTAAACTGSGGTVVSSCTATGRIGRCALVSGGITLTVHLYTGVAADLQATCAGAGGTWTAG